MPANSLAKIEQATWIYNQYFMLKWRNSLRRKQELFPDRYDFRTWMKLDMRSLTRALVEKETSFPSLESYLDGYSIGGNRLQSLRSAALVVATADDPVIPSSDFLELEQPSKMRLELLAHGGHCGFLQNWSLSSWMDMRIACEMRELGLLES